MSNAINVKPANLRQDTLTRSCIQLST